VSSAISLKLEVHGNQAAVRGEGANTWISGQASDLVALCRHFSKSFLQRREKKRPRSVLEAGKINHVKIVESITWIGGAQDQWYHWPSHHIERINLKAMNDAPDVPVLSADIFKIMWYLA
jgi:hypothetical protein